MGHAFFTAFGITAALVLAGGYLALRWRRDREQFLLMQGALEQGLTELPNTPPYWFVSVRQAATIVTLGMMLILIGFVLHNSAAQVQPPEASTLTGPAWEPAPQLPPPPPGDGPGPPHGPGRHPHPPRPYPQLELWHRAQTQSSLGMLSMAAGVILLGLGSVRAAFGWAERRYVTTSSWDRRPPATPGS